MTGQPDQPQSRVPSAERAHDLVGQLLTELRGLRDSLPRVPDPDTAPQRHLAVAITDLEHVSARLSMAHAAVSALQLAGRL